MSWLRLDTNWSHSEWLIDEPCGVKLAWVQFLCHVKAHGERGSVRAINPKAAARLWFAEVADIARMLEIACKNGVIVCEGSNWVVGTWDEYQGDKTSAKRQADYRDRLKSGSNVTVSNGNSQLVTGRDVSYGDRTGQDRTIQDVTEEDVTETTSLLLRVHEGLPAKYPALTIAHSANLIGSFDLETVEPIQLKSELLKFQDFYTNKPSPSPNPNTYSSLLKWLQKVDPWKRKPAPRVPKPERKAQHVDEEGYAIV